MQHPGPGPAGCDGGPPDPDYVRHSLGPHHCQSGYHKGLTGDQLTLPQQIVAVADILSALYGKRSYKEAFSSDLIKKIMTGDAENNKINKGAVDILMRNYDKVITAFEKEKENTIGLYLKIKEQYAVMIERFEAFN